MLKSEEITKVGENMKYLGIFYATSYFVVLYLQNIDKKSVALVHLTEYQTKIPVSIWKMLLILGIFLWLIGEQNPKIHRRIQKVSSESTIKRYIEEYQQHRFESQQICSLPTLE